MNISELKSLWIKSGFHPNKRLGQNFLIDKNIRDNIINAIAFDKKDTLVEIGSGFGVMTFELAKRCKHLYAVERDDRIYGAMAPLFEKVGNITAVFGDMLEQDISSFAKGKERIILFGNIPYYITTPLVEMAINNKKHIKSVYLVIQREFADRLVSGPGSKAFGSISCYVQYFTKIRKVFNITKNCFYPRPEVDSSLVEMEVLASPSVKVGDEKLMFKIIRKAFTGRRKKIVNTLALGDFLDMDVSRWREIFSRLGIDPALRAEDLSLSQYAAVADEVTRRPA